MKIIDEPGRTIMMCETLDEFKKWVADNVAGEMLEGNISTTICTGIFGGVNRLYTEAVCVVRFSKESNAEVLAKITAEKAVLQTQMDTLTAKEAVLKPLVTKG